MVRKVTRGPLSSRRPASDVVRAVVSRAGGRRNAARQAGEGLAARRGGRPGEAEDHLGSSIWTVAGLT
jgi:hypothetical protein